MEAEVDGSEPSAGLDTVTDEGGRAVVEGWRVEEKRRTGGGREERGQLRSTGSLPTIPPQRPCQKIGRSIQALDISSHLAFIGR